MAVYYKWIKGCSEGSTLSSGLWSYIKWAGNANITAGKTVDNLPHIYTYIGKQDSPETENDLGYILTNNAEGVKINKPWEFNQITFNNSKYYINNYRWNNQKDVLYIGSSGNTDPSTETYIGTNFFRIPLGLNITRDIFSVKRTSSNGEAMISATAPIILGRQGLYLDQNSTINSLSSYIGIYLNPNGNIQARGKIESNDSVHAPYFNATSDMRAKENIKKLPFSALSFINNLSVYQFNYKGKNETIPGVLAQDVLNSQPEGLSLVDNIDASGENGDYMSIKEDKFIFILMRAIQELKEDNDSLRYELEQLKQKLK